AKLKDRMRNIRTDNLTVKTKEEFELKKRKKITEVIRLVVDDPEGNEGVVYLFDGTGKKIAEGDTIIIEKGAVKSIGGETALTLGNNGNVYVVA
ncbi:hypothetical protein JXB01_00420, partial [Candidatus Micrarchaeota archaeon]|nr:hypothetical protein [Candidatus Micrarchaeota archaeon]